MAVAAGLGLAAAVLILARPAAAPPPPLPPPAASPSIATADRASGDETPTTPVTGDPAPSPDRPTPALVSIPSTDQPTLDRARALIERPAARCIYVTIDAGDPAPGRTIDTLVKEQPRTDPDYAEYTLTQGILIDPSRPGQARVFSLVVTEPELRALHGSLARHFPGRVAEPAEAAPEILAQLAEVDRVTIATGTPGAPVQQPAGGIIATRQDRAGDIVGDTVSDHPLGPTAVDSIVDRGSLRRPSSSRGAGIREVSPANPAEHALPVPETMTLLVWIEEGPGDGRDPSR